MHCMSRVEMSFALPQAICDIFWEIDKNCFYVLSLSRVYVENSVCYKNGIFKEVNRAATKTALYGSLPTYFLIANEIKNT